MRYRWLVPAALSFVAALVAATAIPAIVQGSAASQAEDWTAPRTPWGDPDLQGIWTNEINRHVAAASGQVRGARGP